MSAAADILPDGAGGLGGDPSFGDTGASSGALDTALDYNRRGWAVVPIPYRQKKPVLRGWPALRITEADAADYFPGGPHPGHEHSPNLPAHLPDCPALAELRRIATEEWEPI